MSKFGVCGALALFGFLGGKLVSISRVESACTQEVIQGKTIKAERFIVVDKNGEELIKIQCAESGSGAGIFLLQGGKSRADITVTEKSSSFSLRSRGEDKSRVIIMASDEAVVATFEDKKGNVRGLLEVGPAATGIKFFDSKGSDLGEMYFKEDGAGGFKLYDRKGKAVWQAPP